MKLTNTSSNRLVSSLLLRHRHSSASVIFAAAQAQTAALPLKR